MNTITADLLPLAVDITTLNVWENNPRRGDVEAVRKSYEQFGQRKPIVARRGDRVVIAGNHQLLAARELGWNSIAVVWVDDDDVTANAYGLADNRTADLGTYDDQALAALLTSIASADPALLATISYSQDELDRLIAATTPSVELTDPDEVPDLPTEPVTKTGEIWTLGPHRLICGDATDPAVHTKLMCDSLADCVWTDPPYGVSYQSNMTVGEAKRRNRRLDGLEVANDTLSSAELQIFLSSAFDAASDHSRPGAVWYVASPSGEQFADFATVLRSRGIWRSTIVWVKDQFVFGRSDYHYRHESIFYGWKPGAAHHAVPDRTQDSVWEIPRPRQSKQHPTMKPVALIVRALENSTNPAGIILDPFAGSGSTLIAAHDTGRTARLIELDPRYCDVIIQRYEEHTGQKAKRA